MIAPEQYAATPVYELLKDAASGRIPVDHRFLHAIVDNPDRAIPDLLKWGLEDHEEEPLDLEEDLTSILLYLKRPEALPFYVHCVKLHPEDIPDDLVMAFHTVKEAAVEPLLDLYEEVGEEEGGDIAFLLASFRIPDERIRQILTDRLEFDAGDGAIMAGIYGDPALKPAIEKILAEIPADDTQLRGELTDAIEQLGRPVEPVDTTYDIWAEYPEIGSPIFALLNEQERLEMFRSPSADVRTEAAESFINRDLSDEARKRLFSLAKGDESEKVRGMAWQALSHETENSVIREEMVRRLEDRDAPLVERSGALIGLARELDDPSLRSYAEEFYINPQTRAAALESMWRSLQKSFAEYFPRHLDDPDGDVKRQAIWGVGYLAITSHADKLTEFFTDEDYRADALFAYALGVRYETSRSRMPGLLRKIEEAAGALTVDELEMVKIALDERLAIRGQKPFFFTGEEAMAPAPSDKVGRNDPCPCGSGRKYKKCHGAT